MIEFGGVALLLIATSATLFLACGCWLVSSAIRAAANKRYVVAVGWLWLLMVFTVGVAGLIDRMWS